MNKIIVASSGLIVCALLFSCNNTEQKTVDAKKQEPVTAPALEVFGLQKGKLSSSTQMPGELMAYQQVDIYAKLSSFIKKLYVDVGTEVSAGQLLATLEAPELNSQLLGASSRLHAQEAICSASKSNYDRLFETSKTPGTISPNDLDQAAARMHADQAQLASANAAYHEIADNKKYLEIRAPFSGVISARNVNTGAIVGPAGKGSDLPLFTLQEQKKLRLVISVPEASTGFLNKTLLVNFSVKSLPSEKFTAKITRLAGALDLKLRSERVEMDVNNSNKKLLPGMVAEVTLPSPAADSTFIVPRPALVNSTEKIFVVRVSNGKASWVNVKPGREVDGRIEIYGDLKIGDSIAAVGTEEIRNGSEVKKIVTKTN
jgi:RND family efflux transporter MFP subunit